MYEYCLSSTLTYNETQKEFLFLISTILIDVMKKYLPVFRSHLTGFHLEYSDILNITNYDLSVYNNIFPVAHTKHNYQSTGYQNIVLCFVGQLRM